MNGKVEINMRTFRDYLKEQSKDLEYEKTFYESLQKTRLAYEITYFREQAGISQAELAQVAETSQSAIARLENPHYLGYSVRTLKKIADALDLELAISFKKKHTQEYQKPSTIVFKVDAAIWKDKPKDGYKLKMTAVK